MGRRQLNYQGRVAGDIDGLPAVSPAGEALVYYDLTANEIRASTNGGAYVGVTTQVGTGTVVYDPPSLGTNTQTTTTIPVTGSVLGQLVSVSFSLDLQGMQLTGYVSVAGTVTVVLRNGTAGTLDLASGTLRAKVS